MPNLPYNNPIAKIKSEPYPLQNNPISVKNFLNDGDSLDYESTSQPSIQFNFKKVLEEGNSRYDSLNYNFKNVGSVT